jgi:methionyl-tRNA formyltransferase
LLVATMDGIEDGTLRAVPQPADGVSIAGKISVDDARLEWTKPAIHIDRLVRACTPAPGAWTTYGDQRLKLGPVRPTDELLPAGEIAVRKSEVLVGTATVAVRLSLVQAPGRREMAATDWARGARLEAGQRLG